MKVLTAAVLLVILASGVTSGGDYIRLAVDTIPSGAVAYKLEFFVERTCPEPIGIRAISNGFVLSTTGTAEFQYAGFQRGQETYCWFETGAEKGLLFIHELPTEWGTEGEMLVGAAIMPGFLGMPVLDTEYKLFDLFLDVRGEGEILIDSAFTFTAGSWKWSLLECGLGGAPDRPLFLAKDSSDLNHPIQITVFEPPCGDANLDGAVDIDDIIYIAEHIFSFLPAPNPWYVADVDCSGQLDIDDIVYLLNYVFGNGPAPCDTDGDGVPDC